jgi:uridine kinase
MRRNNIEQVGPYEVKLDFLDSNLRSFKMGEQMIYKPLVYFEEDCMTTEEMAVGGLVALIAEGTYTSLLRFVDFRIFIIVTTIKRLRPGSGEPGISSTSSSWMYLSAST